MASNEVVCIVDKTGSMQSKVDEAVSGFNDFIRAQAADESDDTLTLVLFDTKQYTVWQNEPLGEQRMVNANSDPWQGVNPGGPKSDENKVLYAPGGMTALLDAVGATVDQVGERLATTPPDQRPDKVVVAILTDGQENSSQEYTYEQVRERIQHQEEVYGWEFHFLGVGADAWAEGSRIGTQSHRNYETQDSGQGVTEGYGTLSANVSDSKVKGNTA